MADYNINAVTRRVVYDGSSGVGPYAFSFEVLEQTDIVVYFNTTKLTLTTDYTVTINANGTGSVTIVTGTNVPSTPTASDQIVVVGARDLERVTDFVTAGDLRASALNDQLDSLVIFDQQISEEGKRTLRAPVYDPALVEDGGTLDMTLPAKATRAGKLLGFDDTTGNPVATFTVDDASTISAISADIGTLADIEDGTIATDAISGVAAISSDVTTVSGIAGNVSTVAGISSNVTSVAGNTTNINTVAGISGNVTTVAGISADVTTVAGDTADIGTLADIEDGTVATNAISNLGPISTDITTVSGISSNVTSVAGNATNINTVAGVSSNVTTVAGISGNVTTVAGISADVTTVAGISSNVTTVANNVTGVNSFAERYRVAASDPVTSLDEGDLVYNTTSNALKFYDGSSWNSVNVTGIGTVADDTTPQLGGNLDLNNFDITGTGNLNFTGNVTLTGTVDGRDVSADGTKLDGIESGATADQTGSEIASAISGETVAALTVTDLNTTSVNGGQIGGRRNLIYNGAMQVAQRGTSFTGVTISQYTLDRWYWLSTNDETVTIEQVNDHPKNAGQSIKVTVTTADATTTGYSLFQQRFEGFDVQKLGYGSSDAKNITVSFWVKSSATGNYSVRLYAADSNYIIGSTITVNSASTWEYKTVTFVGDTVNVIPNDNTDAFSLSITLSAGTTYTSTDNTSWATYTTGNLAYGQTAQVTETTSATFQLADVQMEVGSVATEFEHRSYGEELALCQRYYIDAGAHRKVLGGYVVSGVIEWSNTDFPVTMRAAPTMTLTYVGTSRFAATAPSLGAAYQYGYYSYATATSTGYGYHLHTYTANAEL